MGGCMFRSSNQLEFRSMTKPLKIVMLLRLSPSGKDGDATIERHGIEAQEHTIRQVAGPDAIVVAKYIEHETATSKARSRPVLDQALAECKKHGARLAVARLDRLARDCYFL